MSDLVERLRESYSTDVFLMEVADEIERLHAERLAFATESEERQAEIERLEGYCRDYAEMTGITLNVSDEQREAFNKALSTQEVDDE